MPCPHGKNSTPQTCSQCLSTQVTSIEVRDGWIYENGQPKISMRQRTVEQQREETEGNAPTRKRVCGRCHLPGHNAATCNRPTIASDEESLEDAE